MTLIIIFVGVIKSTYQRSGKEFEQHVAEWFRHGKQRLQREIEKSQKQITSPLLESL